MKRILLVVFANVAVMVGVGIILMATGLWKTVGPYGFDLGSTLIYSAVVGFSGAFISLAISKWLAKMIMKIRIIDSNLPTNPYDKWLVETVYRQAQEAGLKKMPEVGVYESDEVNAFATGPSRNNSLVAFSAGLLGTMSQDAVEGVAGHEVAHIANGDMVTMTLLQGIVNTFVVFLSRVIAYVAGGFVDEKLRFLVYYAVYFALQIIFGILGTLVVMGFSRYREYAADKMGAQLSSREKMTQALRELQRNSQRIDSGQPAMASLKISNMAGVMKLFSSHPDLEDRIRVLQQG